MKLEAIQEKDFITKIKAVPALPKIINKLQSLIPQENVSIAEVTKLIESDVGIISQILRIVNSSYFNLPQKVTKIKFAVAFLGLNEIYRICLTLSVINNLKVKDQKALNKYWIFSYLTARIGKLLAGKYSPALPIEKLFPSAMLHNIGQLVYLKYFPESYHSAEKLALKNKISFNEAIEELKMVPSSFIGSALCSQWQLSNTIIKCCTYQKVEDLEKLNKDNDYDLIKFNILASYLSSLTINTLTESCKERIIILTKETLNLNEDQFLSLMGDIYETKIEVENFLTEI